MPRYQIKIAKGAVEDIEEITLWYSRQFKDLGPIFLKQTKDGINSLCSNPEMYTIRYGQVRCMPIHKFPFLIHYTINDQDSLIQIYAILHTSRDPRTWKTL